MGRINVFLKDDLLKAVDIEAEQGGMSRSAFIQEALRHFLSSRQKLKEENARRHRMEEACRVMDELAKKAGNWDPVAIIRRFRDSGWQNSR